MKVGIEYGVWGDPLQEQLEKQGYKFKNENAEKLFPEINKSVSLLHIHGLITDTEWKKILNRTHKKLEQSIVKVEE